MRLTERQIEQISDIGHFIYGKEVRIYLFGSRTDDHKKGGDIDLFIETETDQLATTENKLKYLVRLKQALGDQKIDLVYSAGIETRPSFKVSILKNRIRLC